VAESVGRDYGGCVADIPIPRDHALFGGEALSGETKPEDFHDLQDGKELGIAVGARCSIEVSRDRPYRF
jgi:hypothetical protein